MRMRKKKHGEERLSACSDFLYSHRAEPLTDPSVTFGKCGAPVYLEIGAGKGGFACGMAAVNPDVCYYAMERVSDCVVIAAERAKQAGTLSNLRFIVDTADNITSIFAPASVDAVFLNFSDPWSKKGYAKRRLTHRRYLAVYLNILKDGGILRFKTDNVGLFEFTLEEIEAIGLTVTKVTRDLHSSEYNDGNIMTEYETAFSSQGVKINMVEIKKPEGFSLAVPEELCAGRKRIFEKRNKSDES